MFFSVGMDARARVNSKPSSDAGRLHLKMSAQAIIQLFCIWYMLVSCQILKTSESFSKKFCFLFYYFLKKSWLWCKNEQLEVQNINANISQVQMFSEESENTGKKNSSYLNGELGDQTGSTQRESWSMECHFHHAEVLQHKYWTGMVSPNGKHLFIYSFIHFGCDTKWTEKREKIFYLYTVIVRYHAFPKMA